MVLKIKSALLASAALLCSLPAANGAFLAGTTPVVPGQTVVPGLVLPGTSAGTLLGALTSPYSFATTAGTTSGSLTSEVFRNLTGTLDFYYQVANSAGSATAIARNADTSFAGFNTAVGFRLDGGSVAGTFVNGTVAPVTSDRSTSGGGSVVGFQFNPPDTAKVLPGTTSNVVVISTDAIQFTAGNAAIIDGGTQTVAAFQPASAAPEPASMLLIGAGLLAVGGIRRFKQSVY